VAIPLAVLTWLGARASSNERLALRQALEEARVREGALLRDRVEQFAADWVSASAAIQSLDSPDRALEYLWRENLAQGLHVADPRPNGARTSPDPTIADTLENLRFVTQSFGPAAGLAQIRAVLPWLETDGPRRIHGRDLRTGLLLRGIELGRSANLETADLEAELARWLQHAGLECLPLDQRRLVFQRAHRWKIEEDTVWTALEDATELSHRWRSQKVDTHNLPEGTFLERNGVVAWRLPGSGRLALITLPVFRERIQKRVLDGTRDATTPWLLPPSQRHRSSTAALALFDLQGPLAGWQLRLPALPEDALNENAGMRNWQYLGIGALTVIVTGVLATLGIGVMRQQIRLAQVKNDLVATVSHELKTPITSIRLLVDTLLENEAVETPADAREYLSLIQNENRRLGILVDKFLTFSRLERGQVRFDFQTVDPARLAQAAAQSFRERFDLSPHSFVVESPADLRTVRADEAAMHTALTNLLENAFKYTGAQKHIALRVREETDATVFEVQDDGPGIPKHESQRIFERFYQPDRKFGAHDGGVGLGLSIVSRIVRQHRGRIQLRTPSTGGSCFQISLPHHA